MRLLLVEDDADLATAVAGNLRRSGFSVDVAGSTEEAEDALGVQKYAVVLLDLGLPDGDGLELLERMRRRTVSVPVLILTARDRVADRVAGLEAGADDYLVKPFAHEELVARIRALLRRPRDDLGREVRLGDLRYLPGTGEFFVGDEPLILPRREKMLLEVLLRRAGRVVVRAALEEALWDFAEEIESNTLESHVSRLRRRLDRAGARVRIHTVRGVGYMLRADES